MITLDDGTVRPIDGAVLVAPLERALRARSWSTVALATAFAIARFT